MIYLTLQIYLKQFFKVSILYIFLINVPILFITI